MKSNAEKNITYFNQVDSEDDAGTDVEECMLVVTRTRDNGCFYINNNNNNKYQTTQHAQHKLFITF
jgi:hypothetical protein